MNFIQAKTLFQNTFLKKLEEGERTEIFFRLVEHFTGFSKLNLIGNNDLEIDETLFTHAIDELLSNKPIQYIVGHEWFGDLKLFVNEHTLIPRPETEELAFWVIETLQEYNTKEPLILDIGTGSGCIALYIKNKNKNATVLAFDKSEKALKIAEKNAKQHQLEIDFFQDDILKPFHTFSEKFDVIISNPPYILPHEKNEMASHVVDFEPNEALFVTNNDALQFYTAIVDFALQNLKKDGFLFLETHQDYAEQVLQLCIDNRFKSILKKDMYENNRMIRAGF